MSEDRQVASIQVILKKRLTTLHEDAQSERVAGHLSKALGLTSTALGCLAAVTTGGLATIPIGVGLVAYASGVMSQAKKTGRVMLLPFSDIGTIEMIAPAAKVDVELPDLEDYAYMSAAQKAEYALILCCGNRLAQALSNLPSDEHRYFAYSVAKRRFHELYGQHIKHSPELLMAVDAAEVAEYVLATEDDFKKLRAGVEREQSQALLNEAEPAFSPEQEPIGSDTRMGAIAVPAAPISPQPSAQQWDEDEPEGGGKDDKDDIERLRDALGYPAVLLFGASGAGKSTLARWVVYERQKLGHSLEILDPHVAYGQWEGLAVYGAGLNYAECDERLGAFADLVESRYRKLAEQPKYNPRPHTLLTEEFTNWASHCPRAASFFSSSMSDLRKVNMFALYVAHGKTLTALGGSRGTAQQRDASLLMIELDAKVGADGRPVPAGKGRIYYPGQHDRPVEITVPNLDQLRAGEAKPGRLIETPKRESVAAALTQQMQEQSTEEWDFSGLAAAAATEVIDGLIARCKATGNDLQLCMAEFLEFLKEQGDGAEVSVSEMSRSSKWASKWERAGLMLTPQQPFKRQAAVINVFFDNARKKGLVEQTEKGWKVALK